MRHWAQEVRCVSWAQEIRYILHTGGGVILLMQNGKQNDLKLRVSQDMERGLGDVSKEVCKSVWKLFPPRVYCL